MFKNILRILLFALIIISLGNGVHAYTIPWVNTKVHYFYVFGKDADPFLGAEDNELTIYFEIPRTETQDISISVFDPNTGGKKDWRTSSQNPWDTVTEFSLYGRKLIHKKKFYDKELDKDFYTFGPYSKLLGEKTGDFYRFKLVAKGLSGDDENLFKVKIEPDSIKSYSYNITFRLLPHQGDKMYFYPEIPENLSQITIDNYDIDDTGADSWLYDLATKKEYPIKDSRSANWQQSTVYIEPKQQKERLKYVIQKHTQKYGNAGLRFRDKEGNLLPIYFRQYYLKKHTYIFDATGSYDPDNHNISFLWDFGDGNTSTKPVARHTYLLKGTYNVKLTVTDNSDMPCNTSSKTQTIVVE